MGVPQRVGNRLGLAQEKEHPPGKQLVQGSSPGTVQIFFSYDWMESKMVPRKI